MINVAYRDHFVCDLLSLSSASVSEKYASKFSIRFIKPRQSREKRGLRIERANAREGRLKESEGI